MKHSLAILALVLVAAAQAADAPPRTVFTPGDPALKLVERSDSYEKGSFAIWRGTLVLDGKLVIEFDRAPQGEEQPDKDGAAYFEPSEAARKKLPAATNYYAKPATVIWLEGSGREVAVPIIGAEAFDKLYSGTDGRYEFPVQLTVIEFSTGVDCDSRSYTLKYKGLRLKAPTFVASLQAKNLGC